MKIIVRLSYSRLLSCYSYEILYYEYTLLKLAFLYYLLNNRYYTRGASDVQ